MESLISSPQTLILLFITLCFAGLMVMFYSIMRNMDKMTLSLLQERKELHTTLRNIEKQVTRIGEQKQRIENAPPPEDSETDFMFTEPDALILPGVFETTGHIPPLPHRSKASQQPSPKGKHEVQNITKFIVTE